MIVIKLYPDIYKLHKEIFQRKMRYAQIVMGPAGSGKSTYCSTLAAHGQVVMCIKFIHFGTFIFFHQRYIWHSVGRTNVFKII